MPFGEGSVLARRYRLLGQVGRGGMGRVWRAHDDLLHREVAVKEVIFPPGLTDSDREVLVERTLREARSAARLSHPGIVTVHDVVEEDDRPWIVMELVRARSLQEVIDDDGRLPAAKVADIGSQMLAALRVAHASGVLHRDVKPANVLLDAGPDGTNRVVITDFGIARVSGDATLTQTGLVLGSPAYIAPERARGEGASPASDLWALGATLYAACEGRSPHDRVDAMAALASVLHEQAPPPRYAGPLTPVLEGLLVKEPTERMTADQAAADLARAARGETHAFGETRRDGPGSTVRVSLPTPADPAAQNGDATRHAFGGPAPGPASGRSKTWLIVVAAVLVVVAVAAAVVLITHHSAGDTGPSPTPKPTTPTTPAPTPTPTPSATVPAGYHRSAGPVGSSIAVPDGWTHQPRGTSSALWKDPSTGAYIQVDAIPWGVKDPVEHWHIFEQEVQAKHVLPNFREIRLGGRFSPRGWPASDLEYTWTTADHGTMRAVDRGFTANGRQYAILVAAPESQWGRYSQVMNGVFGSFQPAAG
ncbi:serine/threonine-protein kinase [Actinoallomurus iriomotensis]|uniref:non-specific serine/threonine protein kinase n=1 Tax=Actinoallomurus iriomotensis TaxID=478107 RepID=A0A9W6SEL3_9ACTN|nr:serine/threonine-protein kinase [Actinoallomurus iriomotensis]GLY91367.1 serine/threonine protein kinase [Actinoallomurus iriomotensis]